VFSLEPELTKLRDDGVLAADAAAPLIARERREVVSVYAELRFVIWLGVMLIAVGVGGIVVKHLDEIGPLAIAAAIGIASIACYAWCFWRRVAPAPSPALIDDYILLLAALLASADIGYIEHQFHLLGDNWQRHFLLLAVLHGVIAYLFDSRMVLSLAIGALAAFVGVERRPEFLWESGANAGRAFTCAALIFVWRFADARFRPNRSFERVFDHFGTNVAFWGALSLMTNSSTRTIGCLIAIVLAVASAFFGVRKGEETFVIYAWIYGVIAVDVLVCTALGADALIFLYLVVSTIAAIVGLFVTHARLRRAA
jgi:hypothetical protein